MFLGTCLGVSVGATPVSFWLTTADLEQKLSSQAALQFGTNLARSEKRVEIDPRITFQKMLGMGSSLEPTTCSNFWRMTPADREALMQRIMNPSEGIGMNLMRLCIGSPDFTGDPWYSYCDLPQGQTDAELKHFSIERDRLYILPVIQLAKRTNRDLLFFASPWSPPAWMKNNGSLIGGELLPQWYSAYAQYFVRFIQAYAQEGIPLLAITVQNEPGVDRAREKNPKWHYPSCHWTAGQERQFIRDHLGPALRKAGLKTEIWCYDHNYNAEPAGDDAGLAYPRAILADPQTAPFVAGVAFHGYVGQPSAMSLIHQEFPATAIHFTEGSVFGIGGASLLIDRLRNWAESYNAWVLILDEKGQPNNGPFAATYATVRLNSATLKPEFLLDYYLYGQFMKFVPRGAVRVESSSRNGPASQVAFRTPDQHLVLIAANPGPEQLRFAIHWNNQSCETALPAGSVGTWRWPIN